MHMIGPSIQNLDVMGFKQMAIYNGPRDTVYRLLHCRVYIAVANRLYQSSHTEASLVLILHLHKAASVLHSINNCLFDRSCPRKTTPFPCFHSLQQQRSTKVSN
jgi:hypothetical protein